jgi:CO dehydrogenase/acetyl-CoA synthase gamma subunit (corrinoid Fe-S protein)
MAAMADCCPSLAAEIGQKRARVGACSRAKTDVVDKARKTITTLIAFEIPRSFSLS